MIRHIPIACLSALLVIFAGCGPPPPVTTGTLYLDNVTEHPMVISIDGNEMVTVPAGKTGNCTVPLGEHEVTANSGEEVILQQMYSFMPVTPRTKPYFILNPYDTHRYCRVEVVFGNDDLAQSFTSGLGSMMANAAASTAVGDDPEKQKEWIEEKTRLLEFQRVLGGISVYGGEPISRFGRFDHFLTPLPSIVVGSKYSSSARRSVVVRIPNELYNEIETLSKLKAPTQEDLDRAYELKYEAMVYVDDLEG